VAVKKCFPPHSRPKGFACRECHKTFQGKCPEIREAHVRSKHKYLFDMKSVNKAVDGAIKRMTEVKKNIVAKTNPVSEILNDTKTSKQHRPSKKMTRKGKKKEHSILKKKSKQEISRFEKADFNGNTHSSIALEEFLINVPPNDEFDNMNESADDIFESSVNVETNATIKSGPLKRELSNDGFKKGKKVRKAKNMNKRIRYFSTLDDSDDFID